MIDGVKFTEFKIDGMRGGKTVSAKFTDNTLILVGENGSGKTTFLRMLFHFLSGRWSNLAEFDFESVTAKIGGRKFSVSHQEVLSITNRLIEPRLLNRLPPSQRRRVIEALEQNRLSEAEALFSTYAKHFGSIVPSQQVDMFKEMDEKIEKLIAFQEEVANTLQAQILYLPTYRRIERELSSILQGYDPEDRRNAGTARIQAEDARDYVELVEFGMNDVKKSIARTLGEIRDFQLAGATRLSLSYLGDVVSQSYKSVDRHEIESSSDESIDAILNRIDNTILSDQHKRRLREVVRSAKTTSNVPSEHEQIIYHYFSKLIRFQRELQTKEKSISDFCDLCSTYIVDKNFTYSSREISFNITSKREKVEVQLSELSSGEKQIVSLFSHLYLSGRQKYFVLIDEPELSLSVPWQRRFLVDIHKASFCAGLVAVTHSPFIYDNDLRKHAHALGEFVRGADWGNIG